jgi:hypothetical protein
MVDGKIIEEWIVKAEEDFEFASINLKKINHFCPDLFPFSAAEKVFKILLSRMSLNSEKFMSCPYF